jgi:hypothetical protein
MIPDKEKKNTYEFINLTLWWFKVPEILATITLVAGIVVYAFGGGLQIFFCGFWTRIAMVPIRISFVNWKRNLEKEFPSFKREKYSANAYKILERSYFQFEKWAADGLDRVFGFFRK